MIHLILISTLTASYTDKQLAKELPSKFTQNNAHPQQLSPMSTFTCTTCVIVLAFHLHQCSSVSKFTHIHIHPYQPSPVLPLSLFTYVSPYRQQYSSMQCVICLLYQCSPVSTFRDTSMSLFTCISIHLYHHSPTSSFTHTTQRKLREQIKRQRKQKGL